MYYLLLILLVLFFYFSLSKLPVALRAKKESTYVFIICVVLVLLAAFRSDLVGGDTAGYRYDYVSMGGYHSLDGLIERYSLFYMGYFVPSKIFHMMGLPVQVWFGFVVAFYLYSIIRLLNKFSKDKVFSLFVFITIGLWFFSMAGLKQTFAMSIMMLAFVLFIEKKYWWTVLLIILTYYTHQAALIGLAVFPLYYLRNNRLLIPLSLLICGLIYAFNFVFMETMVQIIGNEKWEDYLVKDSDYSYVSLIYYLLITSIGFLNYKNYKNAEPEHAKMFLCLSIIGCGLQFLASISPSLFRLSYLYTPFLMILLPNVVYYSKNKSVQYILIGSMTFYFLYVNRNFPYSFV